MAEKIKIKEECIGCGACQAMCPAVFELDGEKAKVKKEINIEENQECITQAIASCPVSAIEIQ